MEEERDSPEPPRTLALEFGEVSLTSTCLSRCELEVRVGDEVFRTNGVTSERNRATVSMSSSHDGETMREEEGVAMACISLRCRGHIVLNSNRALCAMVVEEDRLRGATAIDLGDFWTISQAAYDYGREEIVPPSSSSLTRESRGNDTLLLDDDDSVMRHLVFFAHAGILIWLLRRRSSSSSSSTTASTSRRFQSHSVSADEEDDDDVVLIETTARSPSTAAWDKPHVATKTGDDENPLTDWWQMTTTKNEDEISTLPPPTFFSSIPPEVLEDPRHPGWRSVFDRVYGDDEEEDDDDPM